MKCLLLAALVALPTGAVAYDRAAEITDADFHCAVDTTGPICGRLVERADHMGDSAIRSILAELPSDESVNDPKRAQRADFLHGDADERKLGETMLSSSFEAFGAYFTSFGFDDPAAVAGDWSKAGSKQTSSVSLAGWSDDRGRGAVRANGARDAVWEFAGLEASDFEEQPTSAPSWLLSGVDAIVALPDLIAGDGQPPEPNTAAIETATVRETAERALSEAERVADWEFRGLDAYAP